MINKVLQKIKDSPNSAGVYLFMQNKEIIYVGKAKDLNKRLKSYINQNNKKNIQINKKATDLKLVLTDTEAEALIKESFLIKKYQPFLNTVFKSDANYSFVEITKDTFPRIFVRKNKTNLSSTYLGPFTNSTQLKSLLSYLRDVFPYCTCKNMHKHMCLNSQLNLCYGFCCQKDAKYTASDVKKYRQNISNIKNILLGKRTSILNKIEKEINKNIIKQNFEIANDLKKQYLGIKQVFEHKNVLQDNYETKELLKLFDIDNKKDIRIEMYDISNIMGKFATGSMVVFDDKGINKSEYKKFKIKYSPLEPNDVLMHEEVLKRRFTHDWTLPDVVIIDGGIAQVNTAVRVISPLFPDIKIAGMAKGKQELVFPDKKIK
ncbi:MAG: GIY-YIG nuclease family protein [Candidatus Pacebacteria bacterium]|nr:GIY-YIG nuclease family protein [Candidatus Paceibacterota bacterium]